jgi:hypothetical protein
MDFFCDNCSNSLTEQDEFCTNCGSLLILDVKCINHETVEADGVCIICSEPLCDKCIARKDDIILCIEHNNYEIVQGMVRVFGTNDELQIQYAFDCLEKEGLHPFIYSRKASPLHLGGVDYSLFRASGEYNGHIVNELKLMVPPQEVIESEKILKEVEIL